VLERCGTIDRSVLAEVFARNFRAEPGRGYGSMARTILADVGDGVPWALAAGRVFGGQGSLGNGGAMRAAPVGAYFCEDLSRVVKEARASAEVTHAHPEGQAGAIAVALAAAWAAHSHERGALFDFVLAHTPASKTRAGVERARALPLSEPIWRAETQLGSGHDVTAMDTVPFSLWCAARHLDNFEEAMWSTVAGLGDRDTTCAIVGGIIALRVGPAGLPDAWLRLREPLP
jgi:ADP-ribosylglycohydrolase